MIFFSGITLIKLPSPKQDVVIQHSFMCAYYSPLLVHHIVHDYRSRHSDMWTVRTRPLPIRKKVGIE